ncbi:sigma-70 family RNA polymerase sigma factor [Horticoccus sp. 23ND18S-11]|uniref:sigma-70 family RNA polymerase sigma factor n=1 Tax=Horticoccus sp. 23ND18S-11 TaxID=3391832 RepID=UPI0039C912D6
MATASSSSASKSSAALATALLAHRTAFRAFIVARVGNEADADDLLQNGLIKALQRADELKDADKSVAWFYQILRNTIIDHGRSRSAARRREDSWATDARTIATNDHEGATQVCRCFEGLLPGLKPTHAALLRRVELDGEAVAVAAATLGLTPNNASVTLHRARAELRKQLIAFCGSCASSGCLDCECSPKSIQAEVGRR